MSFSLIPDMVYDHFSQITPGILAKRGITVLLCDLDNTLAPHRVLEPTEEVKEWARVLRENGITLFIVSNNRSDERVKRYAHLLGVGYMGRAKKPHRAGLMRALEITGGTPEHTAILGDLLFTDIIGAKRCGFTAILVEPIDKMESLVRALVYMLEQPVRILNRQKGRPD